MTSAASAVTGLIFDIAHYTIHDGPGIRTTIFLKGCPARCLWCCSPESQKGVPELARKKERCLGCDVCLDEPTRCPGEALQWIGRSVTVEELLREVERDRPFWRRSGGGVTLSGGEPLFQPQFVKMFLQACRDRNIHTALESCLFCEKDILEDLMDLVDYFQFDLKAMDRERHFRLTGVDNQVVLDNAATLLQSSKPLLVRIPLVPGCNDDEANLRALGAFLGRHRRGAPLEILPYHRMGVGLYEDLGRTYPLPDTRAPTEEQMKKAIKILQDYPIGVINEGGR